MLWQICETYIKLLWCNLFRRRFAKWNQNDIANRGKRRNLSIALYENVTKIEEMVPTVSRVVPNKHQPFYVLFLLCSLKHFQKQFEKRSYYRHKPCLSVAQEKILLLHIISLTKHRLHDKPSRIHNWIIVSISTRSDCLGAKTMLCGEVSI